MGNDISSSIPVNLYASFLHENNLFTGIIKTLSEHNMYISTSMDLPQNSMFELHIPFMEDILRIPVKVKRFIKSNDSYNGVDVEVLEPDMKYLDFVSRLKSVCS